jgi:hypothetical protein
MLCSGPSHRGRRVVLQRDVVHGGNKRKGDGRYATPLLFIVPTFHASLSNTTHHDRSTQA